MTSPAGHAHAAAAKAAHEAGVEEVRSAPETGGLNYAVIGLAAGGVAVGLLAGVLAVRKGKPWRS